MVTANSRQRWMDPVSHDPRGGVRRIGEVLEELFAQYGLTADESAGQTITPPAAESPLAHHSSLVQC